MKKQEARLEKYVNILNERKFVSVNEMAQLLGVSNMTVRRDYLILSSQQTVIMKNGIIMLNGEPDVSPIRIKYNLDKATQIQRTAKTDIGKLAASLVKSDESIIIDTGSTSVNIVQYIPDDIQITVLCYNINILLQLYQKPNIKIAFAGGYYHPNTQMFESDSGINFISSFRATKSFISAAGIHKDLGLTCKNSYEVATKKAILESADEHILVADSSKFNEVYSSYFCDLSQIDIIITDKAIPEEWLELLNQMNIKVYIA